MSQQFSGSSMSYSYTSSTSSGGESYTTGSRTAQQTVTDASGNTTVHTAHQNLGEPAQSETRQFDREGRELVEGGPQQARIGTGRADQVEDVTDEDRRNAELYMERMEDEYAKREGGA